MVKQREATVVSKPPRDMNQGGALYESKHFIQNRHYALTNILRNHN